jgi:hypothetical protein
MVCIRRAWLELGGNILALEDDAAGYYCTELNLGYPEVREVMHNRPGMSGADDRTQFFGSRAIAAHITGRNGALTADQISTIFAPYMMPNLRPRLHYILDRPGEPERFITVRAANYAWPISGSRARSVELHWIAADPTMYDPMTSIVEAKAGTGPPSFMARTYNLTFDRIYQTPGGGAASEATIESPGDIALRPRFRIYGPITAARVNLAVSTGEVLHLWLVGSARIDKGQYLEINTLEHTAFYNSDPTRPALTDIDWANSTWPVLPILPEHTAMTLTGTTTDNTSKAQAVWSDGFVT